MTLSPATGHESVTPGLYYRSDVSPAAVSIGGVAAWVATSFRDARIVLEHPGLSRERAYHPQAPQFPSLFTPPPGMIVSLDGPRHERLRRLAEAAMALVDEPEFVAAVHTITRSRADGVAAKLGSLGEADLIADYCRPVAADLICTLLGIPGSAAAQFCAWVGRISDVTGPPDTEAWEAMAGFVAAQVHERLVAPSDDVLGRLAQDAAVAGVPAEEVIGLGFALIGGGFDSTQSLLGQVLELLLVRERQAWEEVVARGALDSAVVEELLRLTDITGDGTTGLPRIATEAVPLQGRDIEVGEAVFVSLAGANRDPDVFPCPMTFNPQRDPNPQLAFGAGAHRCLGEPVVRLAVSSAVIALAGVTPTVRPADRADACVWSRGQVNTSLQRFAVVAHGPASDARPSPDRAEQP